MSQVNTNEIMVKALTRSLLDLMSEIEDQKQLMFSEIDASLECDIFIAIDSKDAFEIRAITSKVKALREAA